MELGELGDERQDLGRQLRAVERDEDLLEPELVPVAERLRVGEEHGDRRVPEHALGDAPPEDARSARPAVGGHDDERRRVLAREVDDLRGRVPDREARVGARAAGHELVAPRGEVLAREREGVPARRMIPGEVVRWHDREERYVARDGEGRAEGAQDLVGELRAVERDEDSFEHGGPLPGRESRRRADRGRGKVRACADHGPGVFSAPLP